VPVPLNDLFAHDLDAMLARLDESIGLVYICNPNDPTGTLTRRSDVERFLQRLPPAVHVLIDEVYHPYVASASPDAVSFLDRPVKDRRLIVVRSFSTVHGLDGLRVGYAVADAAICRKLRDRLQPDDVNAVGAAAALAALEDPGHVRESVRRNEDDRQEFFNEAGARMVRSIDSHTNFVMLDTDRPSLRVIEHFKTNGIAIAGNFPYFAKHIRVSIGTADEMREFWRVWDLMPRQQMKM
jgi:histidinol-phosphate aminotransferase